ncbi:TPA: hypothetical protein ACXDAZ_002507 [Clostridium botulinum]
MITLIVSKYLDGEIKSIEGYTIDKVEANKKVKELNYTVLKGKSYFYTTEEVEKI